ncbi:MAG: hypothetical protein KDI07_21110 [Anaerolineae bacterium]|nr:hypothetical protein [Anaerolineae bacterium]
MMKPISQQEAAEFVRLYDSLIAAGEKARCDAYGYYSKYIATGDNFNADRWLDIFNDLGETLVENRRKRNKYEVIAGELYDVPAFLKRQAD